MTYQEKIKDILEALKKDNYKALGDRDNALKSLKSRLDAFPAYIDVVARQQALTPIWRVMYDDSGLRDKLTEMDRRRKTYHDAVVTSCRILNRLCEGLGLEPFTDVNADDRYECARMAGDFVTQMYAIGQKMDFDEAVMSRIWYDGLETPGGDRDGRTL